MPVFIKIPRHTEIDMMMQLALRKIGEAKHTIQRLEAISHEEMTCISQWESKLDIIHEHIEQLEEILTEPEVL